MTQAPSDVRGYYDAIPYASFAYPQCAPEQLAAVAHLHGLGAPPVAGARVLELGCSSGGNLLPVALRHSGASVLGLDISASHIARGQARAERLGLANARLAEADLTTLDAAALGEFDYVICHGLHSWIPRPAQEAMFALVGQVLAPEGVAYVSFNAYPGWKTREIARDAMLLHAEGKPAHERLAHARAMLGFLRHVAPAGSTLARVVEENIGILNRTGDDYLAHDYLEIDNHPSYFRDFVAQAGRHGLAWLAQAEPSRSEPATYGPAVAQALAASFGDDRVRREQYLDFAVNRGFHQTLLVRAERGRAIAPRIDRNRLRELHLAADLACHDPQVRLDASPQAFGPRQGVNLQTVHPAIKLAAVALTRAWPGTVSRDALLSAVASALPPADTMPAATLALAIDELFEYLVTRGLARFRLAPVALAGEAGPRPRLASDVRRQLAAADDAGRFLVNAWHDSVELTAQELTLLPLLDGEHDRDTLAAAVPGDRALDPPADAAARLDGLLDALRRKGLLSPHGGIA